MSFILDYNCFTPLGNDVVATAAAVEAGRSGIHQWDDGELLPSSYYASRFTRPFEMGEKWTRLERMMLQALEPVVLRHPPKGKSLLLVSTTKGNISALSQGVQHALLARMAEKLSAHLGFTESPWVISNACVSGILAVGVGKRLVDARLYDRVYIVAGDEVTEFVLSGFACFQALGQGPCRPYDARRDGVSLGEAAAAVVIASEEGPFRIVGEGSLNDANHISGPSRTGEGLYRSIQMAVAEAGIQAPDLGFISAHGTATLYNDEMEARAFDRLHLSQVPVNSLKGYFGHTLGASGLLEAVVSFEGMRQRKLFPTMGYQEAGTSKPISVLREMEASSSRLWMKTASGFGGTNAVAIFENQF